MRILVVCKGNTCRSPMFAAVLRRRYAELGYLEFIEVESAGYDQSARGQNAAPEWFELQRETGVDLSEHKSRWIGDLVLSRYNLILCMDQLASDAVIERGVSGRTSVLVVNHREGGIKNPWGGGVDAYRECFIKVCEVVDKMMPRNPVAQ